MIKKKRGKRKMKRCGATMGIKKEISVAVIKGIKNKPIIIFQPLFLHITNTLAIKIKKTGKMIRL